MLSPTHLTHLFDGLAEVIDFSSLEEITMEANPATFDLTKAKLFRESGVQRVSLGIQSFTPHVLETLGREHSAEQARASVSILREAGIPMVNIDLMFAIPGQTVSDWRHTLAETIALQPDHVSAYNLTYEEDTPFLEMVSKGAWRDDPELGEECFTLAHDMLKEAGFAHYETSNYAKPGKQSSHNHGYWRGENYLGFGPSAVSTIGGGIDRPHAHPQRSQNIADTDTYVRMIQQIGHAMKDTEVLDSEAWRLERIALMLRTEEGLPLSWLDESSASRARILAEEGLGTIQNEVLVLHGRGRVLVDSIAGELI